MVYSSEIRWFFETLAEAGKIETWFNQNGQFLVGKWQRADIYLWQDGLKNHSLKIREGKVEVKILQENRGGVELILANSGNINNWVKYSFALNESDEENKTLLQRFSGATAHKDLNWIKVDKERLLLKYAVDYKNNTITKIESNAWPEEGCGVELTKIEVNGQVYYTFGLEAFSKNNRENQNLNKVLTQILEEINIYHLQKNASHSYPGFLASLRNR